MLENKDYDLVIGKLPRKDKNGKDTTGDRIGKGGRHRDDGTYSSVVYDLKMLDEVHEEIDVNSFTSTYDEEHRRTGYDELPLWGQFIIDIADETIPIVLDGLTEVAKESFKNWIYNRRKKKTEEKNKQIQTKKVKTDKTTEKEVKSVSNLKQENIGSTLLAQAVTSYMPDEFDSAWKQYSEDISSEEAQKELIDAFILYVLAIIKLNRISNANIVDSEGKITDGRTIIEKLITPEVIDKINSILEHNPELLESWQCDAISGIIGRNIIKEKEYIPFTATEFKEHLFCIEKNK